MSKYEVGEIPPEQLEKQKKRLELYSNLKPKTGISENHIPSKEDKAIADKAARLIVRDYGEVIKKLEEE